VKRKEGFAVFVEERVSFQPILTARKLAKIRERLSETRRGLKLMEKAEDAKLYGEGLMEYARLMGQLEGYVQDKARYFK